MTIQMVISKKENAMGAFSIAEAKAQLSAIIEMVENGEPVTITKRGRPVVKLLPVNAPPPKPKLDLAAIRKVRESMPPSKENAVDMVRRMRDETDDIHGEDE